jgi:DNA-binding MarR family transcriptional regulator
MSSDLANCRDCLCLASRRAARTITQVFDRHMRPHGLRATQFTILTTVILMKEPPIGTLAKFLGMDRTTLTRNLSLLEDKGWIRTRTDDADARSHIAAVTRAGEKLVREALPAWRKAQDSVTKTIGPAGVAGLTRLAQAPLS